METRTENGKFAKDFDPKAIGSKVIMEAYAYRPMPKIDKDKAASDLAEQIRNDKDSYAEKAIDVVLVLQGDITVQQDMVSQRDWKMYVLMDLIRKGCIYGNGENPDFKPVSMEAALTAIGVHCGISVLCMQSLNGTGPVLDLVKAAVDIYTKGGFFMVKR